MLQFAAECLIATFDGIRHWPALEHARNRLMTQPRRVSAKDVAAATDQLAAVLEQRKLLA